MNPSDYAANGLAEIRVPSTLDHSEEPSLFYRAEGTEPRPLLVGLHTWSFDRHNQVDAMLPLARMHNWHLLLPEFRGANLVANPRAREACGSRLARQDIVDAVEHVCRIASVDRSSLLLLGGSGGGHMALMMAGYCPKLWRSVASFVPITDLEAWYNENANYAPHVAACCGGVPSDTTREVYREHSPITYAARIAESETVIYHGKYDKSVPVTHSLRVYDAIHRADPKGRVFLNIFDGAHELLFDMAEAQFVKALSRATETGAKLSG